MIYSISVGIKTFDFDRGDCWDNAFQHCEKFYGFKGEEWEQIKNDYDTDRFEELLHEKGIEYQEYDDE